MLNTEIYEVIKSRILLLEYPPGTVLNENILCKEFHVSRTPLREVLNRLQGEHLVRIFPRMGTMVTEIEFQQMMNALLVRGEIESLLGRLVAEEITSEHITKLKSIQNECVQLQGKKNRKELVRLDMNFRKILYDASKNSVLNELAQSLYELTLRLWVVTMDKGDWDEEVSFISREMKALINTLSRKKPDEAAKIKKDFLSFHYDRITTKFLGNPSQE